MRTDNQKQFEDRINLMKKLQSTGVSIMFIGFAVICGTCLLLTILASLR